MSKVALVTGASSGIGESIAVALAADGWRVYAVARRVERMASLEQHGIRPFRMDVTDDASMVAGIDRIIEQEGRIDLLVNNAGYGSYGPVEHVSIAEARRQFEVNVFGPARLVQLVTPHMRDRHSGRIVNISSIGGKVHEPLGAWYHATKFALEGFSDSLRVELAPFGIDVVIIEPGPIRSEWNTIAREGLLESARGTAYETRATAMALTYARTDGSRTGSGPGAVAEQVMKAVGSANPAPRYPAGRGARAILIARRVLPDRAMDVLIGRAFRP